jgi:hypothetical protein
MKPVSSCCATPKKGGLSNINKQQRIQKARITCLNLMNSSNSSFHATGERFKTTKKNFETVSTKVH